MKTAFILLPNNLFQDIVALKDATEIYFVEESLFFRQYPFHKQKLVFHRASMKAYEKHLQTKGLNIQYIPSADQHSDIRQLIPFLANKGVEKINMYEPCDDWLEKRINKRCHENNISITWISNPLFINTTVELEDYLSQKKKYFQTDFYIHERKKRKILVDNNSLPLEGKWSFDAENRAKYPAKQLPPKQEQNHHSRFHTEAIGYVETHFAHHHGEADPSVVYPATHTEAIEALNDFLQNRFGDFGKYEDAIVKEENILHHSVLSPLLNTGLLLPMELIGEATRFAFANNIPFNSLEGFVRQVLGWREFIRMIYLKEGRKQRTRNFWNFKRKIPAEFYDGTTGIEPVDETIKKLNRSAYNHHIERLMILSNFMLLCEFDPDEVYRWFMEMYIDAYDWVMVPNVYGMGQFADGGLMCTKPYISGSNYILKMSNYKKGPWADTWDALFWRFMHVHRSFFMRNPRLKMLISTFDKWDVAKKQKVLTDAETFLNKLDNKTSI